MLQRDLSFDTLLDLNGQVLVIDPAGYWVRFVVHRVPVTPAKPHGLDYTLTLHAPDGTRLVGFDNAHAVGGVSGAGRDHRHRRSAIRIYRYRDAGTLMADFWSEVEAVMREEGVWT